MTRYARPIFAVPLVVFSGTFQNAGALGGGAGRLAPRVPLVLSVVSATYSPLSVKRSVARYRSVPLRTSLDEAMESRTLTVTRAVGVTLITVFGLVTSRS